MPNPPVNLGDVVRVRNTGQRTLKWAWDSKKFLIEPGAEAFVPFEAAKLYCGDPRATMIMQTVRDERGLVAFLPDRPSEIRRLRLLYIHGFGDYLPGESEAFDEDRVPHVEVYTVKNERIVTVLDDPDGDNIMPAQITESQNAQLLDIVQRQGSMIQALMDRLGMSPTAASEHLTAPVEPPKMVYDPQDDTIKEEPPSKDPEADPEVYDDLPEDTL